MQWKFVLFVILAVTAVGCSSSANPEEQQVSPGASALTPAEAISYELPSGTGLSVLQEGEINGMPSTYLVVIGSPDTPERLALTALPSDESSEPWSKQAAEWEEGFLEKMSRKISSEPSTFDDRQAHHIVAEADTADGSVEIEAYFLKYGKWSYTIALTAPSIANADTVALLEAIRDSIHIR
ncbi:MAG TPA: hypothetical protein DDW52_11595 [Planctomycetaceae bacterium]|nr:hypothetical protein [Planctomycetaceae bacterium]